MQVNLLSTISNHGPTISAIGWDRFYLTRGTREEAYPAFYTMEYWDVCSHHISSSTSLITIFMRPTWGPSGADRTQVGPILAPRALLSGMMDFASVCCLKEETLYLNTAVKNAVPFNDIWRNHGMISTSMTHHILFCTGCRLILARDYAYIPWYQVYDFIWYSVFESIPLTENSNNEVADVNYSPRNDMVAFCRQSS